MDILDKNRNGHIKAKELWKHLVLKEYEIVISEDILTNIYYISKDKTKILEFLKYIQKSWKIVCFGQNIVKNAIDLSLKQNLDFEDVLQCLCAKESGCETILTNDKKFFDCGIAIYTPNEFLQQRK